MVLTCRMCLGDVHRVNGPLGVGTKVPTASSVAALPRHGRHLLGHSVIAALACACLLAIATDTDRWPFSPYAMYSWIRPASYSTNALVGVTAEAPEREFPLFDETYLHPFDAARL